MDDGGATGEPDADVPEGSGTDGVAAPEKLFSPEGDFMLIWGSMAGILTMLEVFAGSLPLMILGGAVAAVPLLAGAAANAIRRFRPPVGFYLLVTLGAAVAAGAGLAYTDALVAPAGYAVIALANAGRVYELGYRDSDSLLDPRRDDGDASDAGDDEAESDGENEGGSEGEDDGN
jgi:hypothetical protein